jgi:protoheme ferro-lyase
MNVRHVVLVTYGEPPTSAFLPQLTYSWRILLGLTRTIAPIPRPVLPLIALARARYRTRMWNTERYRSPLEPITAAQCHALRDELNRVDGSIGWRVWPAYEFRRPSLADVVGSLPPGEPVDVVPMYAADSDFTHGLSRATVARLRHRGQPARQIHVLPSLDADALGSAAAEHILASLDGKPAWKGPSVALVLAAHGTLVQPLRPVNTGREATERLCAAIRSRLSEEFGVIVHGWLNHSRGGRWTEPPIDQALHQVIDAGFTRAVYFPYGFLADNAESELEGRIALRGQPRLEARHLPCLNDSPRLIEALAHQVRASRPGMVRDARAS